MKKSFLPLIVFLFSSIIGSSEEGKGNENSTKNNKDKKVDIASIDQVRNIRTIDSGDTVIFDLSLLQTGEGQLSFPVSIISDDEITSLDFSYKYNQEEFLWDTIMAMPSSNVSPLSNYNMNDSIVRFTSYSSNLAPYILSSPIVNIRFDQLSGTFSSGDLRIVAVYLNGEPCTYIVKEPSVVGIQNAKQNQSVNIFPIPADNAFSVFSAENATIIIYDLTGKIVINEMPLKADETAIVNTVDMNAGIYFAKIAGSASITYRRLVIEH